LLGQTKRKKALSNTEILVTYRLETSGDIAALAAKIASDQSTGTFTELPGETAAVQARCAARVIDIQTLEPMAQTSRPSSPSLLGVFMPCGG